MRSRLARRAPSSTPSDAQHTGHAAHLAQHKRRPRGGFGERGVRAVVADQGKDTGARRADVEAIVSAAVVTDVRRPVCRFLVSRLFPACSLSNCASPQMGIWSPAEGLRTVSFFKHNSELKGAEMLLVDPASQSPPPSAAGIGR